MSRIIVLLVLSCFILCCASQPPTWPSFPPELSLGFIGKEIKDNLIATGWTYFDITNRQQRMDYVFPPMMLNYIFAWGSNILLAHYGGFKFETGMLTCENGSYPAPFPYPNTTLLSPAYSGVQSIEPFGPCYAWTFNLGPYSGVFYTQVSNNLPAAYMNHIYEVRYFDTSDSFPEGTMNTYECTNPNTDSTSIMASHIVNEYRTFTIARDSYFFYEAIKVFCDEQRRLGNAFLV